MYCMELVREWFMLRGEFEEALEAVSGGDNEAGCEDGWVRGGILLGVLSQGGGICGDGAAAGEFQHD